MKKQYIIIAITIMINASIFAAQENRPWLRSLFQRQRPVEKTTLRPESTTVKYRDVNEQPGLNPYDSEIHAPSVLYPQREVTTTSNKMLPSIQKEVIYHDVAVPAPLDNQKYRYGTTASKRVVTGQDGSKASWVLIDEPEETSQPTIFERYRRRSQYATQQSSPSFLTKLYNWWYGL